MKHRCPRVRWSLLPFAFVVLGLCFIAAIVTLRNIVTALTVAGAFFAEGVDGAKVEHAMSTAKPVMVVPSPRFILPELFDDAQTALNFGKALLISSAMECESCRVR